MGQAWREFHKKNLDLIRQTFQKLRLSLAVDGSENNELSIKDIPHVKIGDWHRYEEEDEVTSVNSIDMEDATGEINQQTNISEENEAIRRMEYVMKKENQIDNEFEENRNSDSELDDEE